MWTSMGTFLLPALPLIRRCTSAKMSRVDYLSSQDAKIDCLSGMSLSAIARDRDQIELQMADR
jgi:hypothetical protein